MARKRPRGGGPETGRVIVEDSPLGSEEARAHSHSFKKPAGFGQSNVVKPASTILTYFCRVKMPNLTNNFFMSKIILFPKIFLFSLRCFLNAEQ